jgi:hypothetical protein
MYFGYNIFKEEGNPPVLCDFALEYPGKGKVFAADGLLTGGAETAEDASSENEAVVPLKGEGSGIVFDECQQTMQVAIRYKTETDAKVGFYSEGNLKSEVTIPKSESYRVAAASATVIEGFDLEIKLLEGEGVYVDTVVFSDILEAENGELGGVATAKMDKNLSGGGGVIGARTKDNRVSFKSVRGGDTFSVIYKSFSAVTLGLEVDGTLYTLDLPEAKEDFIEKDAKIDIPNGANISVFSETGNAEFDGFRITGLPNSDSINLNKESNNVTPAKTGISAILHNLNILFFAGFIILSLVVVLVTIRIKRKNAKSKT